MLRLFADGSLNAVKLRIYGSSVIEAILREPRFPDTIATRICEFMPKEQLLLARLVRRPLSNIISAF